jgi:hypothetical protein
MRLAPVESIAAPKRPRTSDPVAFPCKLAASAGQRRGRDAVHGPPLAARLEALGWAGVIVDKVHAPWWQYFSRLKP